MDSYICKISLVNFSYTSNINGYDLQIPIFEKGYEKDPAIVAKEAIQEASRNNSDVVLVDTAGRMQVRSYLELP